MTPFSSFPEHRRNGECGIISFFLSSSDDNNYLSVATYLRAGRSLSFFPDITGIANMRATALSGDGRPLRDI